MADNQELSLTSISPISETLVTSELFEAYLACPTKCFLLASAEFAPGNDFTIWSGALRDSYLRTGLQRLLDESHAIELVLEQTSHWKHAEIGKGFWHACADICVERAYVVAPVVESYPLAADVEVVSPLCLPQPW